MMGLVFLGASATKWRHPMRFADGVMAYDLLPEALAPGIAITIIIAESVLAFSHITGLLVSSAAYVGCGLLVTFIGAVSATLVRGLAVSCSCFGSETGEPISIMTLVRLFALLGGEIGVVVIGGELVSGVRHEMAVMAFVAAAALVVIATWMLMLPGLMELIAPCPNCTRNSAVS
jgi:hypothetical protein